MPISWEGESFMKAIYKITNNINGRNYFDQSLNYPLRQGRAKKDSQPVETILAKRSTLTIDT